MEAQPPHSIASTNLQPTSCVFPPEGEVSVAPQTEQDITVVALENITTSAPQSLHDTLIKFATTLNTSLIYKFEFLCPLTRCIMSLASLCTSK
tara:strand:- start:3037 stop:3315 length:279 start_codon:yes stop_codon:yes gene_type:complete